MWWPRSHCMSEADRFEVVFEPFVGGRIFERGPDGTEYSWGEVTGWEPPHRVTYLWHIFLTADRATTVDVTFRPAPEGTTVTLRNSGFEAFGEGADERMGRVGAAWATITQAFASALSPEV